MTPNLDQVSVTTKSCDLLLVSILDELYVYETFEYVIYNEDKTMLRKGKFRAPSVQIRTSYLREGKYHFQLLLNGQEWRTTLFEKYSPEAWGNFSKN